MEEEIDLRPYIRTLLTYWRWIVGTTIAAALAVALLLSLEEPVYEATSLVVVTEPNLLYNFEERIETLESPPEKFNAYPEVATSDEVLLALLQRTKAARTLEDLKEKVETRTGQDPSLIYLAAQDQSSEVAAEIANEWAVMFTTRANQLYGTKNDETVTFLEKQVAEAEAEREAAEQALIAFQKENRVAIFQNQLDGALEHQKRLLSEQVRLDRLSQNVTGLQDQLAAQPPDQPAALGDHLTAISLQIQTYNASATTALPVQLQLESTELLAGKSVEEQRAFLDDLLKIINAEKTEVERKLDELEPTILSTQQKLQEATTREERLTQNQQIAAETYTTLVRKVEEARIASQDSNQGFKIASKAVRPQVPLSSRSLLSGAVAGILGFVLSSLAAFVYDWWRRENPVQVEEEARETDVAVVTS